MSNLRTFLLTLAGAVAFTVFAVFAGISIHRQAVASYSPAHSPSAFEEGKTTNTIDIQKPQNGDTIEVIGRLPDGIAFAIDKTSMKKDGEVVTLLVLVSPPPTGDHGEVEGITQKIQIDCYKHQANFLQTAAYDKDMNILKHLEFPTNWIVITPQHKLLTAIAEYACETPPVPAAPKAAKKPSTFI